TEIALIGEIWPLADFDRIDRFRHQPVQIRITLPVRMGAQIDRDVVGPDRQVSAVIEIVAAQEILVGFALAAVLRNDETRYRLRYFSRTRDGTRVELHTDQRHLAGHAGLRRRSAADIGSPRSRNRSLRR